MDKSVNLLIESEAAKLRGAVIGAVSASKLPAAVTKMVLQAAFQDIIRAIDEQISAEKPPDDPQTGKER